MEVPVFVSASQILARLLTVDANDSGLNANTLQGYQASAFALASALSGYLAATGATAGGTTTRQSFGNGLTLTGGIRPASDSTTALQLQNAAGTAIVNINTTDKITRFLGAVNIFRTAAAFNAGNFAALVLGDTVSGETAGALMAVARLNSANKPFVAFTGYDSGTVRYLYFGGGGWGVPDANRMEFYTASAYNETVNAGTVKLTITSSILASVKLDVAVASTGDGVRIVNSDLSGKAWSFIPVTNGTDTDMRLYEYATSGSDYRFYFKSGGLFGIGNNPTAWTDIAASTTARASLRIRTGVAPTSPNDGDIWQDGTDLKMRIGGVTKTFTLV